MENISPLSNDLNHTTQPLKPLSVFSNWEKVPKGWYAICPKSEIKKGQIKAFTICGHRIVIFKTKKGEFKALDAFCPHMGLNLDQGKVEGEEVRCLFHGWKFNGDGECTDIPCKENPGKKSKLEVYATEVQYDWVWVYPEKKAPHPVFVPRPLRGKKLICENLSILNRRCHPHIPMINGIDTQHVRAVHGFDMVPQTKVIEHADNEIEFYLSSDIPKTTFFEKMAHKILGGHYAYSNIFIDGTIALLNSMKGVRLFNKYLLPECNIIYSLGYSMKGTSRIIPIAVTERRPGLWGFIVSQFVLKSTILGFWYLKQDEGDEFFKNIRFRGDNMLAYFDRPITKLIQFVNKQKISKWSHIEK